jgi:hypothetical protein
VEVAAVDALPPRVAVGDGVEVNDPKDVAELPTEAVHSAEDVEVGEAVALALSPALSVDVEDGAREVVGVALRVPPMAAGPGVEEIEVELQEVGSGEGVRLEIEAVESEEAEGASEALGGELGVGGTVGEAVGVGEASGEVVVQPLAVALCVACSEGEAEEDVEPAGVAVRGGEGEGVGEGVALGSSGELVAFVDGLGGGLCEWVGEDASEGDGNDVAAEVLEASEVSLALKVSLMLEEGEREGVALW